MEISFDPVKRLKSLEERGLDFADAAQIFDGPIFTREDGRFDYPEPRFQTFGLINDRLMMVVWTPTEKGMRVISMRKCNDREQKAYARRLG
ncbi:MAG: BrnT family toxin [Sphingobium sp.]|uniref:BrnT family toxin n=1 Tax=Sphingobium sp. TaxID=1912891 RepID=UPI001A1D709F|nr:BrnT family toxin [Sphingobium sp.]MBJ7445141.1 BrnT family toxin [Sphingobium sp.]